MGKYMLHGRQQVAWANIDLVTETKKQEEEEEEEEGDSK